MQKHTAIALAQACLILVVLLWFVSVMVDCDSFLSQSCDQEIWKSWLDLWRLGWIQRYKELIAGLVAAAAAALVLVSTRLQLNASEQRRLADQRASHVATFTVLAHKFGTAHAAIAAIAVTDAEETLFDEINYSESFIASFGTYYGLAEITRINTSRTIRSVIKLTKDHKATIKVLDGNQKLNAVRARACMEIFNDMAKVANDGGRIGTKPEASETLSRALRTANIEPKDLGRMHAYISWPRSPAAGGTDETDRLN